MLITVASYSTPLEAQIARSKLDSEGVPAFVADEQTINMQWLYSNAMGGARLQVQEPYVDRAIEVLAEDRSEYVEIEQGYDPILCEVCGSANTEHFQKGRRWAFLVFLGINFPLFPVKNTLKCKDCGHINEKI